MTRFANLADVKAIEQELPWPESQPATTLYELLTNTKNKFPNHNAVSYQLFSGEGDKAETLTWSQLHGKVTQTANLFRSLGITETDSVAYVLPNCNETVLTLLGGCVAGIANPINPLLEPEQISAILRETGAKAVVTVKAFPKTDVAQKVAEAVGHAPNVKHVIEVDLLRYLTGLKKLIVPLIRPKNPSNHHAKIIDFNAEIAKQPADRLTFEDAKEDRVAAYFHTGGTTGMPKVAQHKYSGLIYNGWLGHTLLFSEEDNIMCPLPLFHVFACHVILMAAIASGAHVVFPTPQGYRGEGVFDNFWKLVERWKISFIITVPTAIAAMMQRPVNADISTVKTAFSGSSPLPVELFKRFEKATGVTLVEGYGLTEAAPGVTRATDDDTPIGSIGRPMAGMEVRIVDAAGDDVYIGDEGEILVRGDNVFVGYLDDPEATARAIDPQGWLHTGDIAVVDDDGFVYIVDRAKDLIIVSGFNVFPAEVERVLNAHPGVVESGVVGVPHPHTGESVKAFIVAEPGRVLEEDDLIEWCATELARYKCPTKIDLVDEIPRGLGGKIIRRELGA